MNEHSSVYDFIQENWKLLQDYLQARIDLNRLKMIRSFSRMAGTFFWLLVSLALLFLLTVFGGLTLGLYLTQRMGDPVKGFGLTTLLILLVILLLAIFRRQFFINPIIRKAISHLEKHHLPANKKSNQ